MTIVANQISCDICATLKGETNHWLVAAIVEPTTEEPSQHAIAFAPIDIGAPDEPHHLCGHACAHKLLDQWLTSLTSNERQQL